VTKESRSAEAITADWAKATEQRPAMTSQQKQVFASADQKALAVLDNAGKRTAVLSFVKDDLGWHLETIAECAVGGKK
jgi:uncharacterized lipoprotein NlpE involved in copper resistance